MIQDLPNTDRATVTRYSTGCLAISYGGAPFFWWGFNEDELKKRLSDLPVDPDNVTWRERYYDDTSGLPFDYKERPMDPLVVIDDSGLSKKELMDSKLRALATWCKTRAGGDHDTLTTLTILERKVSDLRRKVQSRE